MNPQEQQLIESLFQRLQQSAAQAGPRDPEAEALIQQRVQSFPGVVYYLAQTLLVQERALQQAEARLNAQSGQSSFLPPATPAPGGYQYGTPAPQYIPQPQYQQPGSGVGGFLAGAGKVALGVGGGILVADAAMGLTRDVFGGGGGFGGGGFGGGGLDQGYDQGYQQGLERGEQQDDRDHGQQQGYQQDDWTQQQQDPGYQQQDSGYDQQDSYDSGSFDSGSGGFDSGGGGDSGGDSGGW